MDIKKMSKLKKVVIGILIVLGLIILSGVIGVRYFLGKIDTVEINREEVIVDIEKVPEQAVKSTTIAIFGTDYEEQQSGIGAADATMLLTIDENSKELRVCSLMRDMYMNLPSGGKGNLNYTMAWGGPSLILQTINYNFDLAIDKFIQVDLTNLPKVIDKLGGIELNITQDELQYINGYVKNIDNENGTETRPLTKAGNQVVNGTQAAAYCRIRYTGGGDYKRTERQRIVIEAMFKKVDGVEYSSLPGIINELLPLVKTNMTTGELLSLGYDVIANNIRTLKQARYPLDSDHKTEWTDMYHIIPDMDKTKKEIHKFLYNIE